MSTNRLGLQFHKPALPTTKLTKTPLFIAGEGMADDELWNNPDVRQDIEALDEFMEEREQPVFGMQGVGVASGIFGYTMWFYDADTNPADIDDLSF